MPDADGFSGIARIMAETPDADPRAHREPRGGGRVPRPLARRARHPREAAGHDRPRRVRPAAPLAAPAPRRREGDPAPARAARSGAAAAPRGARARRPRRDRGVARRAARARDPAARPRPPSSRRRSRSSSTSPTASPRGSRAGSRPSRGSTCTRRADGEPLAPGRVLLAPDRTPPRRRRGVRAPLRRAAGRHVQAVGDAALPLRGARLRRRASAASSSPAWGATAPRG